MTKWVSLCFLLWIGARLQAQDSTAAMQIIASGDSIHLVINGDSTSFSNKDMAAYYLSLGLEVANEGNYAEAEDKFRVALLYDLQNGEILYNLGLAQYYQEKYADAIKTFDAAAEFDPENENIYDQRGLSKAMLGEYADAETDFMIMLKYAPNFPMGNYNYGVLLLQVGDTDSACKFLQRSDELGYPGAPAVLATYCNE